MAADAGLFAASWWPYTRYQALEIATDLSIWVRPSRRTYYISQSADIIIVVCLGRWFVNTLRPEALLC